MKLYSIQDYNDSSEIQRFCQRLSDNYVGFLIKQYNLQKALDIAVLETLKKKFPTEHLEQDRIINLLKVNYARYIVAEHFMQQPLEHRKNLITEIMISFL